MSLVIPNNFFSSGKGTFLPLQQLEALQLNGNLLHYIHPNALPAVKQLSVTLNNLTHIPRYLPAPYAGTTYKPRTECCKYV